MTFHPAPTKLTIRLSDALRQLGCENETNKVFFTDQMRMIYPDIWIPGAWVVELDGKWHKTPAQRERDEWRTASLRLMGILEKRVANWLVEADVSGVAQSVIEFCNRCPPTFARRP